MLVGKFYNMERTICLLKVTRFLPLQARVGLALHSIQRPELRKDYRVYGLFLPYEAEFMGGGI